MVAQIIAFAVNLAISFLLTPFIVEHIGKEAYGFVGLALNFVAYAQLVTVALNSMAGRYITISIHQNDITSANKYFSSVFYANLVISFVLTIVFSVVIVYLNSLLNIPEKLNSDVKLLFSLLFLNFIISMVTSIFGLAYFAKNRLDLSAVISIISNILKVIVLLICFAFFTPNVWYIGLATVLTTLYMFVANFRLTKKLIPDIKIKKDNIDIEKIIELLKSGMWNTIGRLSVILSSGLDLLIANLFINSAAMGILSLAKIIPTLILSVFAMLAGVYAPNLTSAYALNNYEDIKQQLLSSMRFLGFLSSIPIAVLFAYGDVFFKLWIPGEDYFLIHIISIFTCIELCFALPQEGLWNVFTVTNKVKAASINLFIMSFFTISSVFLAMKIVDTSNRIYYLGGITSLFSAIRLLTFLPIYGAKCINLKWTTFYPVLFRNFISILLLTMLSLVMKLIINPNSWFLLIVIVLITSSLGFVMNNFLILNKKERKYIFDNTVLKIMKIKS
ncbi:MAG: MATE family efflux transporter [bacterium]|nr:MATE family efflux transporter [bacterium]